jgi:hypothetical protein
VRADRRSAQRGAARRRKELFKSWMPSSRMTAERESDAVVCERRWHRRESRAPSQGSFARAGRARGSRAAQRCRRGNTDKTGPAFAARRGAVVRLHTISVERICAWECVRRHVVLQRPLARASGYVSCARRGAGGRASKESLDSDHEERYVGGLDAPEGYAGRELERGARGGRADGDRVGAARRVGMGAMGARRERVGRVTPAWR